MAKNPAGYVDAFVIPIAKKKIPRYRKLARIGCKIWMRHGALDYRECVGDDLAVSFGLPFPRGLKLKAGETVVVAYIVFRNRAHRDRVNARVMKDPELMSSCDPKDAPFDCERMLYGGFQTLVGA
jgi:uncharacterized protein YbaA (DUF1428 family)